MQNRTLIHKLYEIGAVKFGSFTLKSGLQSPIYIDLRLTVSYPRLLVAISEALLSQVRGAPFDLICGVPYTALPFATAISIQHNIPMILRRKEKKEYGTGKMLEGVFSKGQKCLVVEDVITSGQSLFETIAALEQEGLIVEDAAVLIDREQGGAKALAMKRYRLHSVLPLGEIVQCLAEDRSITEEAAASTMEFIRANQL
jgi:uridine monophosphate synthetase